jgi:hypothetical protein
MMQPAPRFVDVKRTIFRTVVFSTIATTMRH